MVVALGLCSTAMAQRVIRIVVPFGPGAVQDTVARTFSNELGQILGATVVVENRAGAGGTIGTAAVAKAAPDGNTLLLAAASHTLAGHLFAKLPYDPIKDFAGVSLLGYSGYVIAAPSSMGVSQLADYIKYVKARPKQLNYASAGNGSATHLGMASFLAKAGLEGARGELGWHATRKTYARKVYEALGHDLVRTAYALRHSCVSTTIRYLSFNEADVDQIILGL